MYLSIKIIYVLTSMNILYKMHLPIIHLVDYQIPYSAFLGQMESVLFIIFSKFDSW